MTEKTQISQFRQALDAYSNSQEYNLFQSLVTAITPLLIKQITVFGDAIYETPTIDNSDIPLELQDLLIQNPSLTSIFMKQIESLGYGNSLLQNFIYTLFGLIEETSVPSQQLDSDNYSLI